MGTCPDCDENFEIEEDSEIGTITECPKCKVRLEIVCVFPVMFDYAPEAEE